MPIDLSDTEGRAIAQALRARGYDPRSTLAAMQETGALVRCGDEVCLVLPENGRPRYLDPADGFALRQYFDRYADGYADTTIAAVEAQQGCETIATGRAQVVSAADVERAAFGDWTDDPW